MDILKVQKALNAGNWGVSSGAGKLTEDGVIGPKTNKAISFFQKSNNISEDGKIGPETIARLQPSTPPPTKNYSLKKIVATSDILALRAMEIAVSQNGVRELSGNNDGPAVETFLSSVGLGGGYSWCMAFVYWCYQQASIQLGVPNPLVRTGGCMKQWNESRPSFRFSMPKVGDIFILDLGKGAGHTGIVTGVDMVAGTIKTIEGNTNDNGSANGDGVYIRTRKLGGKTKGFIRC